MASSSASAKTYELRIGAARGRVLEAAKFRDLVPALETSTGPVPRLTRRTSGRPREQGMLLQAAEKKYEGTREVVGAGEGGSDYMVVRVDRKNSIMTMTPLNAWYSFRPAITHSTLGLEDAEALLAAKDKKALRAEQRLAKLTGVTGADDEEGGGGGSGGGGGGDGGGGGSSSKNAEMAHDDEGFDDGAGPDWAAREAQDEDGNDGLDMEDEDLFDDDEDDGLGDDDEAAFNARQEAAAALHEQNGAGRRALGAADNDEDALVAAAAAAAEEEDDDFESAGGAGASELERRTKADLKAEKKLLRNADSDDSDDDEEELLDEGAEALEKLLKEAAPEPSAEEAAAALKVAAGGPTAGGKRALEAGDEADEAGKRARRAEETAAQLARAAGPKVSEKDVVMLLHQKGKMVLKELIQHFKPLMHTQEDRAVFMAIVKEVAFVSVEGDVKTAKLNDKTLGRYQLFAN